MKKTALITGASKGIGFAIAKALDSNFENLILVAKHKNNLDEAASNLKAKLRIFSVNLENEKEIAKLTNQITKEFKSLDLLVNNAGIYVGKKFESTSIDEINQLINLNFRAYSLLTNQCLPLLKRGNNSQIINISSCAASAQIYGESIYSATKAAVTTFSNVIRKELNKEGIRITTIEPWGVDTYKVPQPNLLNPNEIGELVEYIVNRPSSVQIDQIEFSNIRQWRGEQPSWIK